MKIDVFISPSELDESFLKERNAVVIDVLRASTSIITALENDALEIIPVSEIDQAWTISKNISGKKPILCGERNGKIIEGFDLGNSPEDFTTEEISGKTLVFCTTNGTRALVKSNSAKSVVVTSFSNVSIVKEYLLRLENIDTNISIVCAGKENRFSLEDMLCAGLLIDKLMSDKKSQSGFILSDAAQAAKILYEKFRGNEVAALKDSEHGRYLTAIGFGKDVEYAAKIDNSQALPIFEENTIKLQKVEKRKFKRVD